MSPRTEQLGILDLTGRAPLVTPHAEVGAKTLAAVSTWSLRFATANGPITHTADGDSLLTFNEGLLGVLTLPDARSPEHGDDHQMRYELQEAKRTGARGPRELTRGRPRLTYAARQGRLSTAMNRNLIAYMLVLVPLACATNESPPAQPPPPPPPPPAAPVQQAPPPQAPAEPSAEERAQAEAAAELAKDIAEMEAKAAEEAQRWTPEMHEAAKKLAEGPYWSVRAGYAKFAKSAHRVPGNSDRDQYRHPVETLEFFGLRPDMTVLEYGPGAGWYTELLSPLLAARGKLIVTNSDPEGPATERSTLYGRRFKLFTEKAPELYGKIQIVTVDAKKPELGLTGSVDMALVIRGMHGWKRNGAVEPWLVEVHQALKPGGVLGIVQHRAKPDADPAESAERGYLPEAWVIEQVQAAGFKLSKKSEINKNDKDTKDHPEGVWTLPPTLRLGATDRDKYLAIGESDRMTLRFVKVAN